MNVKHKVKDGSNNLKLSFVLLGSIVALNEFGYSSDSLDFDHTYNLQIWDNFT
jgi:hypothetical protein